MAKGKEVLIQLQTYRPNTLIDKLAGDLNCKNDAALAKRLKIPGSVISRLRHKKIAISAQILLRIHENTEFSIRELRRIMGDTRKLFS
jgi:hypothetical protein